MTTNLLYMQIIKAQDYVIVFNEKAYDFLNDFLVEQDYSSLFILTDSNTNEHCLNRFLPHLSTHKTIEIIEIEAGESEKNIETCVEIWKILTELGADRKSLLFNLGGGVLSDIGGFVASTFKRGIDFINIPTTLLAMVDAAVGGKNGVDLGSLKNQIGTINTPKMVLIDSEYLSTLPQNEMRSGLAEMLKHGLIYDVTYWKTFHDLSKLDFADFDTLIHRSVEIKNEIVSQDPTEKGIRKALNFGHTLGHAIESYFLENTEKTTLLHGEAIAAGMIIESYLSWQTNLISKENYWEIKKVIQNIFEKIIFEEKDLSNIIELLKHDKKNEHGKVKFVLLNQIGRVTVNQEIEPLLILKAFEDYKS